MSDFCFRASGIVSIRIPGFVGVLGKRCMSETPCLESVRFDSDWLEVIEECASVRTLGKKCFRSCHRLGSVVFENASILARIEDVAFFASALRIRTSF
jgi:hypothetical protein